jgi:hypothetical protein
MTPEAVFALAAAAIAEHGDEKASDEVQEQINQHLEANDMRGRSVDAGSPDDRRYANQLAALKVPALPGADDRTDRCRAGDNRRS